MKIVLRFIVIIAVVFQPALLLAQQAQTTITVTQNSSPAADQFGHVQLATQSGNSTATFPIQNGMTSHQLTFNVDPSVTALTVTVYASTNAGSFASVGSSTSLGGTITWTGTYNFGRVIITGFTGSGSVNADYYGASSAVPAAGSPAIPVSISGSFSGGVCPVTTVGQTCTNALTVQGAATGVPLPTTENLTTAKPVMNTAGTAMTIYGGALSTLATLTTTSGSGAANITTLTITINSLHCFNTTSSAATITRQNSAGDYFQKSYSLPANSDVYIVSPGAMEKQVGLTMYAGTASAINCVMDARY